MLYTRCCAGWRSAFRRMCRSGGGGSYFTKPRTSHYSNSKMFFALFVSNWKLSTDFKKSSDRFSWQCIGRHLFKTKNVLQSSSLRCNPDKTICNKITSRNSLASWLYATITIAGLLPPPSLPPRLGDLCNWRTIIICLWVHHKLTFNIRNNMETLHIGIKRQHVIL